MISKTFCSLPFMAVDSREQRIYKPCCLQSNFIWEQYQSIDEYWHSTELAKLRSDLINGVKAPSCHICWNHEDRGQVSMRQSVNLSRENTDIVSNPVLKQVKLITGKTCNLACMMCMPTISSTHELLWANTKFWPIPVARSYDMIYDTNMDAYIRDHADTLEYIEVLGGEPMFNKDFFKLLEYLISIGANRHITLFVITNGTLLTDKMKKQLLQFKKVVFSISVDGVGLVNEYQRWPSKWNVVEENLKKFSLDFDISIVPTITALNILHLNQLKEFCDKRLYTINNTNLVMYWPQLLPNSLPDELKKQVPNEYSSFIDGNGNTQELIEYIRCWDKQRSISIVDYMPEWKDII